MNIHSESCSFRTDSQVYHTAWIDLSAGPDTTTTARHRWKAKFESVGSVLGKPRNTSWILQRERERDSSKAGLLASGLFAGVSVRQTQSVRRGESAQKRLLISEAKYEHERDLGVAMRMVAPTEGYVRVREKGQLAARRLEL